MKRFLRTWFVPILAAMIFLFALSICIPIGTRAVESAKEDLNGLLDAAFKQIAAGEDTLEPLRDSALENLSAKASATARFLAHDDALLATDGLSALCGLLEVDRIDVADADGVLIGSSDQTRVALALSEEEVFSWTKSVLDDPGAKERRVDESNASLLYACVARADIEGFVLLTRNDPNVASALEQEDAEAMIETVYTAGDLLFEADASRADGFFSAEGNLCLIRTMDGVSLMAARTYRAIYAERNAALYVLGAMALCFMICGVALYLVRIGTEEDVANLTGHDELEPPAQERKPRKRLPKPEETDKTEPDEDQTTEDDALLQPPRRVPPRRKRKAGPPADDGDEDAFDKILE